MKNVRIMCVIALVGLMATVVMADNSDDLKDQTPAVGTVVHGTGMGPTATRGTLTVIYDDGTMETDTQALGLQAGNKFVSDGAAWATFYVDQVSVYWNAISGSTGWLTCYATINTAGTDLGSYNTATFALGGSAAGWYLIDGSTSAVDWVGNATETFVNTVWIAADDLNDYAGIDTSTTAGHGFTITSYTGAGYLEDTGMNAMIRPRLNGDAVPVELQSFSIQ